MRRLLCMLLGTWLGTTAAAATAAVGLTVLHGGAEAPTSAVFYPTADAPAPVRRGPYTMEAAWQGRPVPGNRRLIVISHGSGGSPWPQADLARVLVDAGFVVVLPEHAGDNWHDAHDAGPVAWKRRPREVIAAIDAVGRDPRFAPLLDLDRVGVYGMSAGGLTALALAGGRWSPARLVAHCEAHIAEDFGACAGLATRQRNDRWDPLRRTVVRTVLRWRFGRDTADTGQDDPRIAAVVAAVPAAAMFDPASFARPGAAIGLIEAGQDRWLAPRFHVGAVRAACPRCETIAALPHAGHGALLSPAPVDLSPAEEALMAGSPDFDRRTLPTVFQAVGDFFRKNLLP